MSHTIHQNKLYSLVPVHYLEWPPEQGGAVVTIRGCCVVVLLKAVRVGVAALGSVSTPTTSTPTGLSSNQDLYSAALVDTATMMSHHLGGHGHLPLWEDKSISQ